MRKSPFAVYKHKHLTIKCQVSQGNGQNATILAMDQPISFEKTLESDIQHLAMEINAQRERPEMKSAAEQELVKEAIRAFPELKNQPQAAAPAPAASQSARRDKA
jgi:hypothetical protein